MVQKTKAQTTDASKLGHGQYKEYISYIVYNSSFFSLKKKKKRSRLSSHNYKAEIPETRFAKTTNNIKACKRTVVLPYVRMRIQQVGRSMDRSVRM